MNLDPEDPISHTHLLFSGRVKNTVTSGEMKKYCGKDYYITLHSIGAQVFTFFCKVFVELGGGVDDVLV